MTRTPRVTILLADGHEEVAAIYGRGPDDTLLIQCNGREHLTAATESYEAFISALSVLDQAKTRIQLHEAVDATSN